MTASSQLTAHRAPTRVTAITTSVQLGGAERVFLDFANRAFEFDVGLRVLSPTDGPLVRILNEIGVPCEVVPAPPALLRASQRGADIWRLPLSALGARSWVSRLKRHPFVRDADVVYSQGFKAHLATLFLGSKRVVWHLHEFPPPVTGGVWKALMNRRADAAIAVSEAVGAAWGPSDRPTVRPTVRPSVVPNGVDLDRFVPRSPTKWIHRQLGIPVDHRLIGMPAVFTRWKGQLEVIEAFEMVAAEFPEAHLVIVGGSIYDTATERSYAAQLTAHSSPLTDHSRIHVLPFQSKVERTYPEFDFTIHYSTRAEPFGRVIVEAMACAVPVVAAAEGGPVEIIGEDETVGWLIAPRNPPALAQALRTVLRLSEERRRTMATTARRRAEERYSARRFAKDVAAVLFRALPSPPSAAEP